LPLEWLPLRGAGGACRDVPWHVLELGELGKLRELGELGKKKL